MKICEIIYNSGAIEYTNVNRLILFRLTCLLNWDSLPDTSAVVEDIWSPAFECRALFVRDAFHSAYSLHLPVAVFLNCN